MMQSVSLPSIKLQTANDYNFGLKTEKVAVTQLVSKIWVKKFSPNINHFKGAFCAIRLTIGDAVNQSTTDKARSA